MKKSRFFKVNNHLKNLLKKGVEEGVFSGAAAGVYIFNKNMEEKHTLFEGVTRKDALGKDIAETTFFDLASLTKPLCTALLTLHLIEQKKIDLDSQVADIFKKNYPEKIKKIKIGNLLSHSAGMKTYTPFYLEFEPICAKENKEKLLQKIFHEELVYPEGRECLYSDLDYILLGDIIEETTKLQLDELYKKIITTPLGLEKNIFFQPVDKVEKKNIKNFAATQNCPWRKRILQGEVDDEHSWLLNGVAGHAGLFGTVDGVLSLCSVLLQIWKKRGKYPLLMCKTLEKALERQFSDHSWCLGFDTPTQPSSAGKFISSQSVGHLGFTGTSFWIDPEKDMVVVLLTNRVHPDRKNEKIKKFRPLFHDTLFAGLQT